MHNIAGCISQSGIEVFNILYDALGLLKDQGIGEFGIGYCSGEIYKHSGENLDGLKGKGSIPSGLAGIAHTHLAPNCDNYLRNGLPQRAGKIMVVCSGHFGNYIEKRKIVEEQKYELSSDTFAEVFATLIWHRYNRPRVELLQAVAYALKGLTSVLSYSFLIIDTSRPDSIIAARKGNQTLFYVLSEEGALIASQRKVFHGFAPQECQELQSGEIALFGKGTVDIKLLTEFESSKLSLAE